MKQNEILKLDQQVPFTKHLQLNLKKVEEKDGAGIFSGYASTFGNLDRVQDKMMKGCFEKSITQNKGKWAVLFNHKNQIGINLSAHEDSHGLYVTSKIFIGDDDLPKSKEAWALIKAMSKEKVSMGLSIGGLVKKLKYVQNEDCKKSFWEIHEFEIVEHSVTPIPCNASAEIQSHKSFEEHLNQYQSKETEIKGLENKIKSLVLENKNLRLFCQNLTHAIKELNKS